MDEEISEEIIESFKNLLDAAEAWLSDSIDSIVGPLPDWTPEPTILRLKQIIKKHLFDEIPAELLRQFAMETSLENVFVPGTIQDSIGFLQDMNFLSHVRWAIGLDKNQGLLSLAGDDAVLGSKRREQMISFGRKRGSDQKAARESEWKRWREEAERLKDANPALRGKGKKSILAQKIKDNLKLSDTTQTIRKQIKTV